MNFLLISLLSFLSVHAQTRVREPSLEELRKKVTCSAPLVSRSVEERGFAREHVVTYGEFKLMRTDVGDPDGKLTVFRKGKLLCTLPLSLSREVYLSHRDQLLIIRSITGSNQDWQLYSVEGKGCEAWGHVLSDAGHQEMLKLLSENDGNRRCTRATPGK